MTLDTPQIIAVCGVLGSVIALLFRMMTGLYQDRIADKTREITRLEEENERLWVLVRGITPVAAQATSALGTALVAVEQQTRGRP